MVAQFKAGDRIRCIRTSTVGPEFGVEGDLAIVTKDLKLGESLAIRLDKSDLAKTVDETRFEPETPKEPRVIRKTLLIEAQPEGGFLVSEPPLFGPYDRKHLAAFSRLSDAVGFIEEAMA